MLLVILLLFLTIGFAFAPGVGIFAVVPAILLIAYLMWLVVAFFGRRSPGSYVRRRGRRRPELLGPGGPDDPDR